MTEEEIRAKVMHVLREADYDVSKFYDPETSDDPEEGERIMQGWIAIFMSGYNA